MLEIQATKDGENTRPANCFFDDAASAPALQQICEGLRNKIGSTKKAARLCPAVPQRFILWFGASDMAVPSPGLEIAE